LWGTPGNRYTKIVGGWKGTEDIQSLRGNFLGPADQEFQLDDGWAVGAGLGRRLRTNLRHEIEFLYAQNSVESLCSPTFCIDGGGDLKTYSLSSLLFYDFNRLSLGGFRPYIGGGVGAVFADGNLDLAPGIVVIQVIPGPNRRIHDSAFSWTWVAGVQRSLSQRMTAFAEYRQMGTSDLKQFSNGGYMGDVQLDSSSILGGIRFSF
jgi:opacity protein-like surface antigen